MYAVIFEPGKEPEIWETSENWPGTAMMVKPKGSCIYFFYLQRWGMWTLQGDCVQAHPNKVPPEYRATILILT